MSFVILLYIKFETFSRSSAIGSIWPSKSIDLGSLRDPCDLGDPNVGDAELGDSNVLDIRDPCDLGDPNVGDAELGDSNVPDEWDLGIVENFSLFGVLCESGDFIRFGDWNSTVNESLKEETFSHIVQNTV